MVRIKSEVFGYLRESGLYSRKGRSHKLVKAILNHFVCGNLILVSDLEDRPHRKKHHRGIASVTADF
jgi:hypothetical protein